MFKWRTHHEGYKYHQQEIEGFTTNVYKATHKYIAIKRTINR